MKPERGTEQGTRHKGQGTENERAVPSRWWLAAYFNSWIRAMRSHEAYEEHKLYPVAIQLILEGKVHVDGRRAVIQT